MGTSGSKKNRKGGRRSHLDKVGHAPRAAAREQQRERAAVMDVMGLSGLGGPGRAIAWIVIGVILVLAVAGLLVLTLF